jgi:hypothetical protein
MANDNTILEDRFIRRVLADTAKDIYNAQRIQMSNRGFQNPDWLTSRSSSVKDTTMELLHLKKHRFVDMKFRETRSGRIRKKTSKVHPIHNKIIWGHYNNVIKELHYGFTESVKEEMRKLAD